LLQLHLRAVVQVTAAGDSGDCFGINPRTGNPDDVVGCDTTLPYPLKCWASGDGQHSPKSKHPGGVQVSMCDGSVRFVNENINVGTTSSCSDASKIGVMRRMISISDGLPVSLD
jgi:prepilin-type processing-associated H-X9-DG protein